MYQLNFDMAQFLAGYWHKKPTVIKQGFVDFVDPISPDELAGLAMEEEIDSRFVSNKGGQWKAKHGPLPESLFETLDESHWQLIVQACNHWHLGAAELVEPFKQLPQWLFDDLMVCFSAPEGGVGPHIDQYNVFIIQGSGKRRWRVGDMDKGQYKESIQGGALRQIEGFDAIIDEVLQPGDILLTYTGGYMSNLFLPGSFKHAITYVGDNQQRKKAGLELSTSASPDSRNVLQLRRNLEIESIENVDDKPATMPPIMGSDPRSMGKNSPCSASRSLTSDSLKPVLTRIDRLARSGSKVSRRRDRLRTAC